MTQGEDPTDVERDLQVTALKRVGQPHVLAAVIIFLLRDEVSYVTGAIYNVEGGWVCWSALPMSEEL